MTPFSKPNAIAYLAVISVITTSCSNGRDAASETPADPEPGLYEVTLSGAGLLKAGGKEEGPYSFCLADTDRALFPHTLVKKYYQLHYSCMSTPLPREGNAIAGEIKCAADPKLAQGVNRFIYEGAVSKDAVDINVQMKFDAVIKEEEMTNAQARELKRGMKAFELMKFVIEAKRTDEC
ncbi:MAG: hypothetical protein AAF936_11595 [Pseudomonadota bacterium]